MKTKNTTVFTQNKFTLDENIAIEKAFKAAIYFGHCDKSERKRSGFKFGFVVTKIN